MYRNFYLEASEIADKIRSGEYTKSKRPTPVSSSLFQRKEEPVEEEEQSPLEEAAEMIALLRQQADDFEAALAPVEKPVGVRPRSYSQGGEKLPLDKQGMHLRDDPEFMDAFAQLNAKHGVEEDELFNIIKGESAYDPMAQNAGTKAAGLFQFIPATASDLGVTVDDVLAMSPAEQVNLYGDYLDRWDYQGEGLGIMQAAPALRSRGETETVYAEGSAAWKANPGWRPSGGGDITRQSINNYYRRKR